MALTNKQVHGVCNMFANGFVNAKSEERRKKMLIDFEDAFSKGISDWKTICEGLIKELTTDATIIDSFNALSQRKETEQKLDCDIRPMVEEDFEQVREIINAAFDLAVTVYDEPRFKLFVESGCSFVACKDDEVLGVVLAHLQPELVAPFVYINSFAVAKHVRGNGIGKALFAKVKQYAYENSMYMIKLQTDPKIDAYEIYKHWGMQESNLVMMKGYCI